MGRFFDKSFKFFVLFLVSLGFLLPSDVSAARYEAPTCEALTDLWAKKLGPELHIPEADLVLDASCDGKQASLAYAAEMLFRLLPAEYARLFEAKEIVFAGPSPDQSLADTESETGKISIYDSLLSEGREYVAAQLIHESAHLRKEDIDHVTCERGNLKGVEAACAAEFTGDFSGDAYNFSYATLKRLYELAESHPEIEKAAIGDLIRDLLQNNFNRVPEAVSTQWEVNRDTEPSND